MGPMLYYLVDYVSKYQAMNRFNLLFNWKEFYP